MSITLNDRLVHTFFLGFIRLHILHHSSQEPIFGLDMIRELERHGYHLSPGTLYPVLHSLEQSGFLSVEKKTVGGKVRKYYCATEAGMQALREARTKAHELIAELNETSEEEHLG